MIDRKIVLEKSYKAYTGETLESAAKLFEQRTGYEPQEVFWTIGNNIMCGPVKNEHQ